MRNFIFFILGAVLCDFEKKMILETHESISNLQYLTRTFPPIVDVSSDRLDEDSAGYPVAQLYLGISDANFSPTQFTKMAFDMDNQKMFISSKDVSNFTCINSESSIQE